MDPPLSRNSIKKLVSKALILRIVLFDVYAITDQDREQKTPYSDSSHQGLRQDFAKDLFFIWDECAWKFQNGNGKKNWPDYETHILNHGNLGKLYPKYKYGVEGDTPAFLHLLPTGLNDPNVPTHGGWGGYAAWGLSEDGKTSCYTNHSGESKEICTALENHFYQATFNNFAARMDWANAGVGNRNPIVAIDADQGLEILTKQVHPGSKVTLDASQSIDLDGDKLTFKWWILSSAGTYKQDINIANSASAIAEVSIPTDSKGKSFHVICEVTDDGTHKLSSYRRVIVEVTE